MKIKLASTFLLAALLFPVVARAGDAMAESTAAGLLAYSFPLSPIEKGKLDVQAAPAYFTTKFSDVNGNIARNGNAKGFGGAAGVTYGLTPHFGLGVSAIYFKSTQGTFTEGSLSGPMSENGFIGAATAIYDPMSGDNFRLPLLVGVNYQNLATNFTPIATQKTLMGPGVEFGISAQFNTGKYFRWEPFLLIAHPLTNQKCSQGNVNQGQNTTTTHCGNETPDTGANPGVNVVFRPWNLAFFYAPSIGDRSGTSIYALRLHKTFGGHAEAGAGVTK